MQESVKYENPNVDSSSYSWGETNPKAVSQFVKLLPEHLRGIQQALNSVIYGCNNNSGVKVGSLSNMVYDPESDNISLVFKDMYSKNPTEFEGRESNVEISLENLQYFSLEKNGITPNLDDTVGQEFPKYAVIRAAAEQCLDQVRVYSELGLGQYLVVLGQAGQKLMQVTLEEVPLTETEKQMLSHRKRLGVLFEESSEMFYAYSSRIDFSGKVGKLKKYFTTEGREFTYFDDEMRNISSKSYDVRTSLINDILFSKRQAKDIEVFDFAKVDELEQRMRDFIDDINLKITKKLKK